MREVARRAARPAGRRPAARCAGGRLVHRRAPGGRDLPRPRRRRPAAVHGRAHGLAHPGRGRSRCWASSSACSAHGVAVVFVSHRLDEVVEIAERVTVLRDGRKVGTFARGEVDARRIGELMTGLVDRARGSPPATWRRAPPLLEVRGLTRAGEYADVAFTLRRGEVLGLTGLLGAGRTELALSLFGMTRPDAGEIRLEGRPIALATNQDAIRAGIAYVSEDRLNLGLNMRQSVGDNLVLASLDRLANALGWIAPGAAPGAGGGLGRAGCTSRSRASPTRCSSSRAATSSASCWASGWRPTPKVLILDSPTVGVDIGNKRGIYELIRAAGRGRRRHPADLRRGAGGVLQLRPRAPHARRPDRRRRACPARSPSTRWRSRSMRDLAASADRAHRGPAAPGDPAAGRAADGGSAPIS